MGLIAYEFSIFILLTLVLSLGKILEQNKLKILLVANLGKKQLRIQIYSALRS